jgi:GNAT superfamily N-acetyltransferase
LLEALQRRASDVWEEYRDQLAANPDAIELPPEAVRERRVRVAVAETQPIGFSVVLALRKAACELDGLFVEPDEMRRGVGRALLLDAAERARIQGARRIEVIANPRAVGFYEKLGFLAGEQVPTRFGPGLRMRLELDAEKLSGGSGSPRPAGTSGG